MPYHGEASSVFIKIGLFLQKQNISWTKFVNLTFFWNFWFRIFALVDIKEEVLHTEGFGKIRVDSDMQVNEETLFNLASNSKLFTSVYAAWVRLVYSRTDREN